MMITDRALGKVRTRADRVRKRRARLTREIEPASRERRIKPRRKRQPRRRYDFALSTGIGVEAQLPAVPTVRVGSRLLTTILLIATLIGLVNALSSSFFQVGEAEILNNQLLSDIQVRSLAEIEGSSIFLINPKDVIRKLTKYSEIHGARVSLRWPNQVQIEIEERQPVVEWHDAGRVWWISADGVAYIKHGERSDLVRVEADDPVLNVSRESLDPVISPGILQAAALLHAQLQDVESLGFDKVHGLNFTDPRGWKVFFGTDGDIVLKIRIYQEIAQLLLDRRIESAVISVENQTAPYYRISR
jgi:hypothetical protein